MGIDGSDYYLVYVAGSGGISGTSPPDKNAENYPNIVGGAFPVGLVLDF